MAKRMDSTRKAPKKANGEGSIWQLPDGKWCARISLPGGKRRAYYGRTRKEVATKLAEATVDRDKGLLVASPNQTVAAYLQVWLDTAKSSIRPRTLECYDLNARRLIPHIGKVRVSALTPSHVQATYTALLDSGLSRRSVELAHAVLHRALRQAVQWQLVGRNVADAVSVPRPVRKEMRTLTAGQVQELFATSAEDRFHALWVMLASTGLRLGEALGLKWEDVDLACGRLTVCRALQRQQGVGYVLVEPKTARSRRTVHLPEITTATLREHRRRQLEERLLAGPLWQDMGLVFCTETGRPVEAGRINESLKRALARAELPRIRVHDLRHTAATLLLSRGVNVKVIQELLGHSTVTLTLNTYAHTIPAMHEEAAATMNAALSGI